MRSLTLILSSLLFFAATAIAEPKLKLGVLLPLSGEYARFGQDAERALDMSLCGEASVNCIFEDTEFNPAKAISAYQKLRHGDNIDILIVLDSPSLNALQPRITADKILTFMLAETLKHEPDTIFQLMPFSFPLYSRLGELAGMRYQRVALLYGSTEILASDAEYFRRALPKQKLVHDEMLPQGLDYRGELLRTLSARPEALAFFTTPEEGIQLLSRLKEVSKKPPKLICDGNVGLSIEKYVKALGPEIFDGCIATFLQDRMSLEFKTHFAERFGEPPVMLADYAYDAGTIIKLLLNKPSADWAQIVANVKIQGASGPIAFDQTGTRVPAYDEREFRGGRFAAMEK